jgi:hypothetical protein
MRRDEGEERVEEEGGRKTDRRILNCKSKLKQSTEYI